MDPAPRSRLDPAEPDLRYCYVPLAGRVTGWMAYADLGFKTWRDGLLLATIVGGYFVAVHLLSGRM